MPSFFQGYQNLSCFMLLSDVFLCFLFSFQITARSIIFFSPASQPASQLLSPRFWSTLTSPTGSGRLPSSVSSSSSWPREAPPPPGVKRAESVNASFCPSSFSSVVVDSVYFYSIPHRHAHAAHLVHPFIHPSFHPHWKTLSQEEEEEQKKKKKPRS